MQKRHLHVAQAQPVQRQLPDAMLRRVRIMIQPVHLKQPVIVTTQINKNAPFGAFLCFDVVDYAICGFNVI